MARTTRLAALVAVLAVAGLVVSVTAVRSALSVAASAESARPSTSPSGLATTAHRGLPDRATTARGPALGKARATQRPQVPRSDATVLPTPKPAARPVRIRLTSVGIEAAVRPVGTTSDGQMGLPDDPSVLGWYRFAGAPGEEQGSTVVAGHLDSLTFGLGPLVRLRDVRAGDRIELTTSAGERIDYVVDHVRRYDRRGLPASLFSRGGSPLLRVITCGGEFDEGAGGYQDNLVVTAAPAP